MNISTCQCGVQDGYPHKPCCPWPYFGDSQAMIKIWQRESALLVEQECGYDESDIPSLEQLMEWSDKSWREATDGCPVEPDGMCGHGCPSWLLALRLI